MGCQAINWPIFSETCMQMQEIWPGASLALPCIRKWWCFQLMNLRRRMVSKVRTRKHSSKMCTTHLDAIRASVWVAITRCCSRRNGDGERGTLPCDLSHNAFDVTYSPSEQTDDCETINYPQLHLLAVKTHLQVYPNVPKSHSTKDI